MYYRVDSVRFSWDDKGLTEAVEYAASLAFIRGVYVFVYVCSDNDPIGFTRGCGTPDYGFQGAY